VAVKAFVSIKGVAWDDGNGLAFSLDIDQNESPGNNVADHLFESEMDGSESASTMNTTIGNYVKEYTHDTWGTTYGLLDTVKIIGAVDGLLV